MTKQEILDYMDEFEDEYGTSFTNSNFEISNIIEEALDLYFDKEREV